MRTSKSNMADSCHIENRSSAISQHHIIQLTQNLEEKSRTTGKYRPHDQNSKFRKFKMADDGAVEQQSNCIYYQTSYTYSRPVF